MDFSYSSEVQHWLTKLTQFMDNHIYPIEQAYHHQLNQADNRWRSPEIMVKLKKKAKATGLWNLFIPPSLQQYGGVGLSNLDYAPLAEQMGRVLWSPEVFNCNAPDTGNMEVFMKYGSQQHKEMWLTPLLAGEIRSSYAMTERHIASSDATNIECAIVDQGDHYLVNGHKWFITGALHENCQIFIVMGKSDPDNPNRHLQQSQILVPKNTPGVEVIRPLTTLGYDDAPLGHGEVIFDQVKVPKENLLLGPGRGFEIAQGRLGPGRIHHCMRLIGSAQRALELACTRAKQRNTFGKAIAQHQSVREVIANGFAQIEQARLLTLKTAYQIDQLGAKNARDYIAAAKISVPVIAQNIIDSAMQIHGAGGLSEDYFMAEAFNYARWCRLADGPDEVHMMSLGKQIIQRFGDPVHE